MRKTQRSRSHGMESPAGQPRRNYPSMNSIRSSSEKNNPQITEGQNSMGSSFSELAERASQDNPSVGKADSSLYTREPLDPSQSPAAENDLYDLDGQRHAGQGN